MPCRDYESDNGYSRADEYKRQCDKLARIACAAMEELVKQGKADFLVLKNEEVRNWWEAHIEADKREKARVAEQERRARVKQEALDRLTDEEKELLGLAPKKKHKKHEPKLIKEWEENYELDQEHDFEELLKTINSYKQR